MIKGQAVVLLCAGLLACVSPALGVDNPLRLPPGAPLPSAATHDSNSASTGLIQQVDPSTLTGAHFVTFQDVPAESSPGINYDAIVTSGTVGFAERFVGQTLSYNGIFDVLSGAGSTPLTLEVGAPSQNLDVLADIFADNILAGLGPLGYPDLNAIGEGAVAMLFPQEESEVGFDVFGIDGAGSLTITFFRHDGTPIDTITVPTVMGPDTIRLAFQRVNSVNEIAGLTIENDDPAGLGYSNIQFGASPVHPAPTLSAGAVALLLTVLSVIAAVRLRDWT
jgi:hypothetical protein